jgi:hypothetical protein
MPHDGESKEHRDGPPLGRPPKLVESEELLKQIEGLARIQCTQREAAAVLRVHRDTFAAFLGTHEKAQEAWENGLEQGKASLRRMQFKNAENGNATMQVWLGKQWLDQRDKSDNQFSGPGGGVITMSVMSAVPRSDADTDQS